MRHLLLVFGFLLLLVKPIYAVDRKAIDEAVDRGVAALKKMQQPDGSWPYTEMGATALAGLTLLECGVEKTDRAVLAAAKYVRERGLDSTQTYSLSLGVLFLDKLDDSTDTPLIESMIVRIMNGQLASGAWRYDCGSISQEEKKRIKDEMTRVLKTGREFSKLPAKGSRTTKDLPAEIIAQLNLVGRGPGIGPANTVIGMTGDNSNTQFATLALWVGRRYGIPTQAALIKVDAYFRNSQNKDGGWAYQGSGSGSSAPMTCAGVLGLMCGHGSLHDLQKAKNPKAASPDITKDLNLMAGLTALSTAIGVPLGWNGNGPRPAAVLPAKGRAYYFLWSLERVAVTLDVETLAKKDWYNWGAEIILANQSPAGTWEGDHALYGADTCFALLFLRKANLARDLSARVSGFKKAGFRAMRAGGVGGKIVEAKDLRPSGIGKGSSAEETKSPGTSRLTPPTRSTKPGDRAKTPEERAAGKLMDDAIESRGERRKAAIDKLRDSKGVAYTEALVDAINKLDADGRREARVALAQRFTRLKDTTLRSYLDDVEPEIRRAAALASAARGTKAHIPDLIRLLEDRDGVVARAAQEALKVLTGRNLGSSPDAWKKWYREQSRE